MLQKQTWLLRAPKADNPKRRCVRGYQQLITTSPVLRYSMYSSLTEPENQQKSFVDENSSRRVPKKPNRQQIRIKLLQLNYNPMDTENSPSLERTPLHHSLPTSHRPRFEKIPAQSNEETEALRQKVSMPRLNNNVMITEKSSSKLNEQLEVLKQNRSQVINQSLTEKFKLKPLISIVRQEVEIQRSAKKSTLRLLNSMQKSDSSLGALASLQNSKNVYVNKKVKTTEPERSSLHKSRQDDMDYIKQRNKVHAQALIDHRKKEKEDFTRMMYRLKGKVEAEFGIMPDFNDELENPFGQE